MCWNIPLYQQSIWKFMHCYMKLYALLCLASCRYMQLPVAILCCFIIHVAIWNVALSNFNSKKKPCVATVFFATLIQTVATYCFKYVAILFGYIRIFYSSMSRTSHALIIESADIFYLFKVDFWIQIHIVLKWLVTISMRVYMLEVNIYLERYCLDVFVCCRDPRETQK